MDSEDIEIIIERRCHICAIDLVLEFKKCNTNQQNDFNECAQKFPEMVLHDGQKKELCGPCYKIHVSGIAIFQENNPKWTYPRAKQD